MYYHQFQPFVPIPSQQVSQKQFTLYIGDLDLHVDETNLMQIFSKFGNIIQVKVARDYQTNQSKGFAFVAYGSQSEGNNIYVADQARLAMNHKVIYQNTLRVCKKKAPQELSPDANIVIKNIPDGATIEEIDKIFQEFGSIFSSRLLRNAVAFVQFEDKESVQKCLSMQQQKNFTIYGQTIQIFQFQKRIDQGIQRTNIYLKNFPDISSEEIQSKLENFCGQYGTIQSILVKTSKDIDKNFAFVCYSDSSDAKVAFDALQLNSPFSQPLYVNWAESRAERNKKLKSALSNIQNETNIFVKNLKISVTKEELQRAFQQLGDITSCDVRAPAEGLSKSIVPTQFGFINFSKKEDAIKVLLYARDNPQIKSLFAEDKVYINYHLQKSQSQEYNNMRKNQMQPFMKMGMMQPMQNMYSNMGMPMQMPIQRMNGSNIQQMPQFPISGIQTIHPISGMQNMQGMQNISGIQNMQSIQGMQPMQSIYNMPQMNMAQMQMFGNIHNQSIPIQNFQKENQVKYQQIQQNQMPQIPINNPKQNKQVPQKQPVLKQKEFGTYEQIKKNKEIFLKKPEDFQRTILGELLFPIISENIEQKFKEFVPKITGMLIDFSVFEVDDILELFEEKESLLERLQEAIDLILQNQQK